MSTETTTSEHIAARDDGDLLARLIAAAERVGLENARLLIPDQMGRLISRPVEVGGEIATIAFKHAYAANVRRELLASDAAQPPGKNLGAATDAHLLAALVTVFPQLVVE